MGDMADYYLENMADYCLEDIYRTIYRGKLVGVTFEPARSNIQHFSDQKDLKLKLVHDKHNRYDKNAVSVTCRGKHLGYIPSTHNEELLEIGLKHLECHFLWFTTHEARAVGLWVELREREAWN